MRFWYLLLVALFITPLAASAEDPFESTLTFQEQVGEYSTYDWRVRTTVPAGHTCVVTAYVFDKDGRLMLRQSGPVLDGDAIFGQPVVVPTVQTALWASLSTAIECIKE